MQKSKDIFKIIFIILASTIFVLIVGLIILIFISKNEYKNTSKALEENYYIYEDSNTNTCIVKYKNLMYEINGHMYKRKAPYVYFIVDNEISENQLSIFHNHGNYYISPHNEDEKDISVSVYARPNINQLTLALHNKKTSWPMKEESITLNKANEFVVEMLLKNKIKFKYNDTSLIFFSENEYKVDLKDGANVNTYDVIVKEQEDAAQILIKDHEADILTGQIYLSGYDFILEAGKNSLGIPEGEKLKFDTLEYE